MSDVSRVFEETLIFIISRDSRRISRPQSFWEKEILHY